MNLFLISAPQQLLGAFEARAYFGLSSADCHLVVVHRGTRAQLEQLRAVAAGREWGRETWLGVDGRWSWSHWLRGWRRLERLARRYRGVDRLFLGFYRSLGIHHFATRADARQTILLDDGLSTLAVPRLRRDEWSANEHFPEPWPRRLAKRMFGVGRAPIERLEYFTIFTLETHEPVHRHRFERIRDEFQSPLESDGSTVFLGSPLVEDGYVPAERYRSTLEAIRGHERSPLRYLPHRRELEGNLDGLRRLGWEIVRESLPVEFAWARSAPPAAVAGFYSSALPNLALLHGGRLDLSAYRLPSDLLSEPARLRVDECYRHFEDHFPAIEVRDPSQFPCPTP